MITDSGDRTQFESGAVRDMGEGKGRCDLLPISVVTRLLDMNREDTVIPFLGVFLEDTKTVHLYAALMEFARVAYKGSVVTMVLEVAKHFEEGAKKYGEYNWQKGIPTSCYIDSAIRHYLKWRRGDDDEAHDKAFVWNILCCCWEVD